MVKASFVKKPEARSLNGTVELLLCHSSWFNKLGLQKKQPLCLFYPMLNISEEMKRNNARYGGALKTLERGYSVEMCSIPYKQQRATLQVLIQSIRGLENSYNLNSENAPVSSYNLYLKLLNRIRFFFLKCTVSV